MVNKTSAEVFCAGTFDRRQILHTSRTVCTRSVHAAPPPPSPSPLRRSRTTTPSAAPVRRRRPSPSNVMVSLAASRSLGDSRFSRTATWNPATLSLPLRRSHVIVTTVVAAAPVRPSVARPFPVIVYIHGAQSIGSLAQRRRNMPHARRTTTHIVRITAPVPPPSPRRTAVKNAYFYVKNAYILTNLTRASLHRCL